jgi:triphosphoribosyl-dephospho-CoA synthase
MPDPLDSLRCLVHSPADAVRWACILEATAPKAGNVHPGRSFGDLEYIDFVTAAEIASKSLGSVNERISERMLRAVDESMVAAKTNVNLGIVLLLGPLVGADELLDRNLDFQRTSHAWGSAIKDVLRGFDGVDGQIIFRAINHASAGGLGKVESMDVGETTERVDIIAAMRLAESRDRIARQYASDYVDLIESVVPVVWGSIKQYGDVLHGICQAHLRLLVLEPDSLIARKNGMEIAVDVQMRAQQIDLDDPASIASFDDSLRGDAHPLNPGTTADLIAAALYVLLRTPSLER